MKKRSLSQLLQKLEEHQVTEREGLINLNDQLSKKMLKGGYDSYNLSCGGYNPSCGNSVCNGSINGACTNTLCLI